MKYSLRSLFVAVTLACVVLGGRIEYLRRWAAFHAVEENRILVELSTLYIAKSKNDPLSMDEQIMVLQKQLSNVAKETTSINLTSSFYGGRLVAQGETIPVQQEELELWLSAIHERQLQDAYTSAASRPWLPVKEPVPLVVVRK